jgi:choline dehydrogenase-like flavoprotein
LLTDIAELASGTDIRGGVCIIGGGAAGITLARQLASRKIDVVLMESGGLQLEQPIQALCGGALGKIPYFPLIGTRLRYLGGTTNHWTGQSVPLNPIDFESRRWVPDSGWPIAYEEYLRYLSQARELCEIPQGAFDYRAAAKDQNISAFPNIPDLEPILVRFSSPPTRFAQRYRADLEGNATLRCYLHASCLGLATDGDGNRVASAEFGSLDGRRVRVRADSFVLAAGAIENSRLLLLSRRPSGIALGNEHDRVGRFFMEHPYTDLYYTTLSQAPAADFFARAGVRLGTSRVRRDARFSVSVQTKEGILNHTFYFRRVPGGVPPEETFGERITRLWDKAHAKVMGGERRSNYMLRVRLEHAPNANSRITLLDGRDALGLQTVKVDFRFGELEMRTARYIQDRVARALGQAGLGRTKLANVEQWVERTGWGWQYHQMGGTRMHDSPRQGVVDANCRVHGTNNLYVASSSVFPTSGHANPTMNMLALTLRLGDHLGKGRAA